MLFGALFSSAGPARAAEGMVRCGKSYHLLRPAPRECLGELETDRPHLTDTPATTPPGHFVLEAGLLSFAASREGTLPRSFQLLDLLLKAGIWRGIDLQLGFAGLTIEHASGGLDLSVGDSLYLRSKLRLSGDGGPLAITLAPVLWAPLRGGPLEGGGMILFGADLPWKLELELNLSAFARHNEEHDGHHLRWILSGALTRPLFGGLSAFLEAYGETWREVELRWIGLLDAGFLWLITPGIQIDGGVRFGLTDRTPPYTLFLGVAFRF
jgi:hypothetical protein